MRRVLFALTILLPTLCFADQTLRIAEIKSAFAQWQPIIQDKARQTLTIYRYAAGENYQRQQWSQAELKSDEQVLSDKYTILQNEHGAYVRHEQYAFSGDWFIVSEHYYDKDDKLFFVFWKMNTFQAETPATVEKRLYFATNGTVIRTVVAVYKLNTKQKQNISFMDQQVDYTTNFTALEFYAQLPKHR